jgi:chemotaxis protein MotB
MKTVRYLVLYILVVSVTLGGFTYLQSLGRRGSQAEIDGSEGEEPSVSAEEVEGEQDSQAREIEELRSKLQDLNIQLSQLVESRDSCYQQIKRLEEEKKSSQALFDERLKQLEEEKIKTEQGLAAARKREEALGGELEQAQSRLRQLIEAEEKDAQELNKLKTEFREGLKEQIATGKVLVNEEKRGLMIALVGVAPLRSEGIIVRPEDKPILHKVASILKKYGDREVLIEGHTDDEPIASAQFSSNWELSTARATTILRYLEEKEGISPERLSAAGYGEYRPLASNATREGREKNRRVEIVILSRENTY